MTNFRTDISKARGLGSAKSGVQHFIAQRASAIILIPLCIWFAFSVMTTDMANYDAVYDWISSPLTTFLLIFSFIMLYYHCQLGLQTVIEDYVYHSFLKLASLLLIKTAALALAIFSIYIILHL